MYPGDVPRSTTVFMVTLAVILWIIALGTFVYGIIRCFTDNDERGIGYLLVVTSGCPAAIGGAMYLFRYGDGEE